MPVLHAGVCSSNPKGLDIGGCSTSKEMELYACTLKYVSLLGLCSVQVKLHRPVLTSGASGRAHTLGEKELEAFVKSRTAKTHLCDLCDWAFCK